ncbi:MAG: CpsD/CapB family tyrosine-protein kinase [Candidatus Latescibacterota bacterium]
MARVTDLTDVDFIEITERINSEVPAKAPKTYEQKRHFDALPDSILRLIKDKSKRPLMFALTSCYRGEGVSTVASNLTQFLAQTSKEPVLLVDLNFQDPAVHRIFGKSLSPGVIDLVFNNPVEFSCVQATHVENLFVLSAGECFDDFAGLYDMQSLSDLMELMKRDYEYVIFDTPPLCEENTAVRLAGLVDGFILVVEAEKIRWEVAMRMRDRLLQADANILGVILNKRKFHVPDWLYNRL